MELQKTIETRRSIRDFDNKEVPLCLIQKALKAGLMAPTFNHLKQWDFILVADKRVRLQLVGTEDMTAEVTEELKQAFAKADPLSREMYLDAIPKQKKMLMEAPELLAVVYKPKTQVVDSKRVYDLNCLASVWCCIENFLLSLAEDDLYGVTFIPQNTAAVKQILGVPKELEVAALIPFGYKSQTAKLPFQKEIHLEDKLHFNRW